MSFKALCEFVIHFDSFRNIDLFNQGLYHLRVSIYHEKSGQVPRPFPCNLPHKSLSRKFLHNHITFKRVINTQLRKIRAPFRTSSQPTYWTSFPPFAHAPSWSDFVMKKLN